MKKGDRLKYNKFKESIQFKKSYDTKNNWIAWGLIMIISIVSIIVIICEVLLITYFIIKSRKIIY